MSTQERDSFGLARVGERIGGAHGVGVSSRPRQQAITDTLEINRIAAPDVAAPGDTVTVRAHVQCLAPLFTDCETIIEFVAAGETKRVPSGAPANHGEGTEMTFETTFVMPETPLTVTVNAIDVGDVTGQENIEASSEATIDAASQQEVIARDFGPWVLGGGAIGAGFGQLTDRDPVRWGVIGAGGGVATKVAGDQFLPAGIPIPDLGILQLVGIGVVVVGGAFVASQLGLGLPSTGSLRSAASGLR